VVGGEKTVKPKDAKKRDFPSLEESMQELEDISEQIFKLKKARKHKK